LPILTHPHAFGAPVQILPRSLIPENYNAVINSRAKDPYD